MDLGLTEIQQMLRNSAREFLSQECPLTLVREIEDSSQGYSDKLWSQLVNLGWTGLVFPEEYGGTGGSFIDLTILLEEMGRSLLPSPFFSTVILGGMTILEFGSESQKNDILPGVCNGNIKLALGVVEDEATYEACAIHTTARSSNGSFVLKGTKLFATDADVADYMVVAARTSQFDGDEKGITLFLVPMNIAGISLYTLNSIGGENQYEVVFDEVVLPVTSVIGEVDQGWDLVDQILLRAVAGNCVEMLGGAQAVLDMTVDYVKQRTQFGRPIGSFQAIQHHCANMAADVEGSRHMAYQAAWRVSEKLPCIREVSMAKVWVSDAYARVCSTAHQCHGAIGFTKEHNLQLYTRRAKVQQLSYGDVNSHKERVLQHVDD